MTAATFSAAGRDSAGPNSAGPGAPTLTARTVHAEWSRIWTVRSSWWFAAVISVVVLGIATLLGIDVRGAAEPPAETAWVASQITGVFGLFGLLAMALVTAAADHGTGGIVPTLQWTPRRGVLLLARTLVVVATTTALGLALATGTAVIVHLFAPAMTLDPEVGAETLGTIALVYGLGATISVGLALLLRSTAAGLVGVLGLMLVLPMFLAILPFDWSGDVADLLPGMGALNLLFVEGLSPMSDTRARITLAVWAAGLMALGGVRLLRSDADR